MTGEVVGVENTGPCYAVEIEPGNIVTMRAVTAYTMDSEGMTSHAGIDITSQDSRTVVDGPLAGPLAVAFLQTVAHAHGDMSLVELVERYQDHVYIVEEEENDK